MFCPKQLIIYLTELKNTKEKEFTSDASHELRTPLTVIKGTLEVLIRKPRNSSEYEEKLTFVFMK
jgi:signal transduction histidine kinase